jgi:hypothetical protein
MSKSPAKPRIVIGSDHAGFPVKETIRKYLEAAGYAIDDQGTSSEESVLAMGGRIITAEAALAMVQTFRDHCLPRRPPPTPPRQNRPNRKRRAKQAVLKSKELTSRALPCLALSKFS